jgi:hypothetical protein
LTARSATVDLTSRTPGEKRVEVRCRVEGGGQGEDKASLHNWLKSDRALRLGGVRIETVVAQGAGPAHRMGIGPEEIDAIRAALGEGAVVGRDVPVELPASLRRVYGGRTQVKALRGSGTTPVMSAFHEGPAAGHSPAAALADAQQTVGQGDARTAAAAAGFVCVGAGTQPLFSRRQAKISGRVAANPCG